MALYNPNRNYSCQSRNTHRYLIEDEYAITRRPFTYKPTPRSVSVQNNHLLFCDERAIDLTYTLGRSTNPLVVLATLTLRFLFAEIQRRSYNSLAFVRDDRGYIHWFGCLKLSGMRNRWPAVVTSTASK